MIDLTDVLLKAERYNSLWSKDSLKSLINKNKNVIFDWDMECGERWATMLLNNKFLGYISSVIPLVFCKSVLLKDTQKILECEVLFISEDDFDDKKWFIDPQRLERESKKLKWIVNEQVLNFEKFSINDFWYATI